MILRTASATRSIRALLALLLGISLIAGTVSNPTSASAASVAKPGATCSKKGATQTIKSIKYTCVKSGKKLVWNKGVRVRATTKPPVLVPDTSSQPLSLDNLDTKRVRQAAFAEVTKVVQSMPAVNPNVTVIAGPSLTAERVDAERAGLKRTASFWADLFLPKTAYIGYYTEADLAWVDSAFCQQAAFCPVSRHRIADLFRGGETHPHHGAGIATGAALHHKAAGALPTALRSPQKICTLLQTLKANRNRRGRSGRFGARANVRYLRRCHFVTHASDPAGSVRDQADSFLRPLARRAASTRRPPLVAIRARKP